MQKSREDIRSIVDQLERTLSQLDYLDEKIAAIHIDSAIVELCRVADIERHDGKID